MVIRGNAKKTDFKFRILQGIDSPDIQAHPRLFLDLIGVIEKEFIPRHEQRHHPEVWFFQPCEDIFPDVFAFP